MQLIAHPRFSLSRARFGACAAGLYATSAHHESHELPCSCPCGKSSVAKKGAEIDLITELYVGDALAWSAVTTVYSRAAKGHGQAEARPEFQSKQIRPSPKHGLCLKTLVVSTPKCLGILIPSICMHGLRNPLAFAKPLFMGCGQWRMPFPK